MRGVYIHIPFCTSICSYCDFCKFTYKEVWATAYLDILEDEIDEYYENDKVKSIYIGGGTPSCLSIGNLKKLFRLTKKFDVSEDVEFTFECNVNDICEELLMFLKENNVNRLSIGVESFNKYNLKFLNRKHTKEQIFNNIKIAKKYFDNINVDLIYAIPIETMRMFMSDVNNLIKLIVNHVSTYSLILEDHTILHNRKIKPIDEETDSKMYKYICRKLRRKGYNHYEVSNFAKNDTESKHNLTYWDNDEYYGFGLGSHGYINNMRYENTRNFSKYLEGDFRFNELLVSIQEEMENEVILGLRKLKGISISEFKKRFDKNIFDVFNIDTAINKGYLINKDDYLYIPEDKIYVMNEIINIVLEEK